MQSPSRSDAAFWKSDRVPRTTENCRVLAVHFGVPVKAGEFGKVTDAGKAHPDVSASVRAVAIFIRAHVFFFGRKIQDWP